MPQGKQDKGESHEEQLPAKVPGVFGFMTSRPNDLVVVVKRAEDDSRVLRSLQIIYCVSDRLSSFQFSYNEPKFQGERGKFEAAALRALLREVSSRHVAHEDFAVWFYDSQDRRLIEDLAHGLAREDSLLSRAVDQLVAGSRLID